MQVMVCKDKETLFNSFVQSHAHGDVLQTIEWGKLKHAAGWRYFPLAVLEKGTVQGTALLLIKRFSFLPHTLAYSPRGPLYSSLEAASEIFDAGVQLAKNHKALVWKMDPPLLAGDEQWSEVCAKKQLQKINTGLDFGGVQPRFVMMLDLRPPLQNLLGQMKSKTRYNIRYATRKGVQVFLAQKEEDLKVFYSLLEETAQRDRFTIRPFPYFQQMWEQLVLTQRAKVFLAYKGQTPLSAAILFRLGRNASYVYGASSNENRNLQAAHLIQWEMIKWAKGQGCQSYNFRGVSGNRDPTHPLYGLYRFKEGFGAQLQEYVGEYDLPLMEGGYQLWQQALSIQRRLRQKK